ncbi:hypothetical protein [Rhodococcus marinonascens]|uniref:hypothetical protein n=1 Tax=Rhodococcus marinonascens TaxID=38311 RepID=UPI000A006B0D|nr:hypothetical protein [Rhodococcus marinonascens]
MNEPIYVHDPEYFQGDEWSPERLRDLAQSMTPATIAMVQRTWRSLGEGTATKIIAFSDGIRREIGTSWQGGAANNADSKASRYAATADPARTQLDAVASALDPIYQAASALKAGAVPDVQGLNLYDRLTPWLSNADQEYYRRHADGLEAMNTIYRPGIVDTDKTVPVFDRLENIITPPAPTRPSSRTLPDGFGSIPGRPGTAPVDPPGEMPSDDATDRAPRTATAALAQDRPDRRRPVTARRPRRPHPRSAARQHRVCRYPATRRG